MPSRYSGNATTLFNRRFPRSLPTIAFGLAVPASLLWVSTSFADVVISSANTQNMNCTDGVCAPTASDAVLNVTDLENLLASGSVEVTTAGSGVQADNIDVEGAFSWSGTSTLSLDAYQSVTFASAVTAAGQAGVSLVTNDGGTNGTLSFGQTGSLSFQNLSSTLAINGASYVLENSLATLASAIAANPAGDFALANSYDASGDGTYANSPIPTEITGNVQGLGNTISNLTINHPGQRREYVWLGLFAQAASSSSINSVRMTAFDIQASYAARTLQAVGGLVGSTEGILFDDHVAGSFNLGRNSTAGGLAGGADFSTVVDCSANVHIATRGNAGGLLGALEFGSIEESYATGTITGAGRSSVGGLVSDFIFPSIYNTYATAEVTGGNNSDVGGLMGDCCQDSSAIDTSYATGRVLGGSRSLVGGLLGNPGAAGAGSDYWDITTSGTHNGTGNGNVSGITGLTNKQFRRGLPSGFDPNVWAEKKGFNGGLPYLIANPPAN